MPALERISCFRRHTTKNLMNSFIQPDQSMITLTIQRRWTELWKVALMMSDWVYCLAWRAICMNWSAFWCMRNIWKQHRELARIRSAYRVSVRQMTLTLQTLAMQYRMRSLKRSLRWSVLRYHTPEWSYQHASHSAHVKKCWNLVFLRSVEGLVRVSADIQSRCVMTVQRSLMWVIQEVWMR